jgi:hypothetical protein
MDVTSQQRRGMKARGAAVYSKDEKRLVRPEIPVEFTLEEYRTWYIEQFGGDAWGSKRCHYGCGRWLTVADAIPDHFKPLARGGRNTLSNLVLCCAPCNDQKGELDGDWFQYLLDCLVQMPESQKSNILERLAKSEKAASSVRSLRGQIHRFRNSNPQQAQEQI